MKKLAVGIAVIVGVATVISLVYLSSARFSGPPQADRIPFERFKGDGKVAGAELEQWLNTHYPPGTQLSVLYAAMRREGAYEGGKWPGSPKGEMEKLEREWLDGRKLHYDPTTTTYLYKKAINVWTWMMVVVVGPKDEIWDIKVYGA